MRIEPRIEPVGQLISYLRFRLRLVNLNRRLLGQPWWRDSFAVRFNLRPRFGTWLGTLEIPAFFIAVVVVCWSVVVEVFHPPVLQRLTAATAGRVPDLAAVLVFCLACYMVAAIINWMVWLVRLSSVRQTMSAASASLEATSRLAKVWGEGQQHDAFHDELFTCYEPYRRQLVAAGFTVTGVADRSRIASRPSSAGAWVLSSPSRLTDICMNAPDAEVACNRDARAIEKRLLAYARPTHAHARTRFLEQWRRLRSGKPDAPQPDALTEVQLDDKCERTEEGLNYVVKRLVRGTEGVTLTVDRARYGQIVRSCDYLIEEAFIVAGLCAGDRPLRLRGSWLMRALPARRAVMRRGIAELISEPRRRVPGIGLAAVVVTREAQPHLFYKVRSFAVGTYPGMYHVVPTGMYNSKTRDVRGVHDQRVHPGRVLLTEFLEELKDVESLDGFEETQAWKKKLSEQLHWLFQNPVSYDGTAVADSSNQAGLFDIDAMRIWVTGIAFDLLSLRPEVCCLIEVPAEIMDVIRLNDEGTRWLKFPNDNAKTVNELPASAEWVRSGYAAMLLACETLERGLEPNIGNVPSEFEL